MHLHCVCSEIIKIETIIVFPSLLELKLHLPNNHTYPTRDLLPRVDLLDQILPEMSLYMDSSTIIINLLIAVDEYAIFIIVEL